MSVLIDLAMNSIGTIRFLNGLFIILQTNLLFYWPSKPPIQKEFNIRDEDDNEVYSSYNVSLVIKVKSKPPPKPGLKCHL